MWKMLQTKTRLNQNVEIENNIGSETEHILERTNEIRRKWKTCSLFSTGVKDRSQRIFCLFIPVCRRFFGKIFFPQNRKLEKSLMLMKKIFCVFENREDLPFSESVVRMKNFFLNKQIFGRVKTDVRTHVLDRRRKKTSLFYTVGDGGEWEMDWSTNQKSTNDTLLLIITPLTRKTCFTIWNASITDQSVPTIQWLKFRSR